MTAADLPAEKVAALAEVLCHGVPGVECSHVDDKVPTCHRDAEALAPLVAGWLAEAWDAGYDAWPTTRNPYRDGER